MTDAELTSLPRASQEPKRVAAKMLELANAPSRAWVSKLEIVFDQLAPSITQMDEDQARGFVVGLFSVADDLVETAAVTDHAVFRRLLGQLLVQIKETHTEKLWSDWLKAALAGANAVDFVTAETGLKATTFCASCLSASTD